MWKYNNNEKMMIVILLVISCLFVNMIPSYSAQVTKESFPSPPWVQKGNAYVQVFDVPLSVAKKCVPSDFNIVETKEGSGLTEGSLYIAKYNNQSTIEYSELIFICATVQYEGKKGNWVHAIYVDTVAVVLIMKWQRMLVLMYGDYLKRWLRLNGIVTLHQSYNM